MAAQILRYAPAALLAALAVGGAQAQDCAATDGHLKETRRGHEVRFRPRIAQIDQALKSVTFEAIALGDSIVQQWPKDLLSRALGTPAVLNAGIGGDGAETLGFRLEGGCTQVPEGHGTRAEVRIDGWTRQNPGRVLLLVGTNDLHTARACPIFQGIARDVGEIARLYPSASVLVVSLLPRGDNMRQFDTEIREVNRLLEQASKSGPARFTFVDAHDVFLCDNRTPCALVRPPNNVHLTREGYERLTRVVQAKIQGR
jgi:platelet-activating factor acetylhydrolase IB subunit beta/gamma